MTKNLIKNNGQVFTTAYLVSVILDEAGYYGEEILGKHVIDNSAGDGAFLCEVLRRYIYEYNKKYGSLNGIETDIQNYIHGIEIEYFAYCDCVLNLIRIAKEYNIENCKFDIRNADTLRVSDYDGMMDFVVGNPPYVRVHNLNESYDTVKQYDFSRTGMTDLYLVFFEKGFKMLNGTGKLCYITPNSWLNSSAGTVMRQYILKHKNLVSLIDLEHFQAFNATAYTAISLFNKKENDFVRYSRFNNETKKPVYICDLSLDDIHIAGKFYFNDVEMLKETERILNGSYEKIVDVKNGFATLCDKVFIADKFDFSDYVIPVVKSSTGERRYAIFPYDIENKPVELCELISHKELFDYLLINQSSLEMKDNDVWYLYGRTQGIKDVYKNKITVSSIIKDKESIKLRVAEPGCGVYGGLYILTDKTLEDIEKVLRTDEFVSYVSSLKKYKRGGFYTFNSKELEIYLNYKLSIYNGRRNKEIDY